MGRYTNEINSLANDLSRLDLINVVEKWIETQERWDNAVTGQYYMEHGWDMDELFCHQILDINPIERVCLVVDLSIFSRPVTTINHLPKCFPTQQEAAEYYSKHLS